MEPWSDAERTDACGRVLQGHITPAVLGGTAAAVAVVSMALAVACTLFCVVRIQRRNRAATRNGGPSLPRWIQILPFRTASKSDVGKTDADSDPSGLRSQTRHGSEHGLTPGSSPYKRGGGATAEMKRVQPPGES